MAYWLIKSEPEVFGFEDLVKTKQTQWDGVRNYAARNFLRAMRVGDKCLFYHSNEGLEVVGIAEVVGEAVADRTFKPEKGKENPWLSVTVRAGERLARPVGRAELMAHKALKDMAFVRLGRLSVQPVTAAEWQVVLGLAGGVQNGC